MQDESRSDCPSAALVLKHLLRRTSHILWTALGMTLIAHGGLTLWRGTEQRTHAAKPLTTQFVKRQPRLTKPLELKKRPVPKRRSMQRKMVSVQARIDRQATTSTVRPMEMVQRLARPDAEVMRSTSFAGTTLEPQAIAQAIGSRKEAASQVDMSLEMVDIEALDTGRYHAMVVQDPNDKRNIRGFFHFSQAQSVTMRNSDTWNDIGRRAKAISKLVEAMNRYTQIRCDVGPVLTLDSAELLKTPFVLTCTRYPFALVPNEAENLGYYLLNGGFLLTDASYHGSNQPGLWSLHTMIIHALESQGFHEDRDYTFEKLPSSHTVYHCYFDFSNGPPVAGDFKNELKPAPYDYLEAVEIEGRVVVIESKKWYCNPWADWYPPNYYGPMKDPTRQLQFGVNLIVFALTQEGSITNRVMDSVRY